MTRIHAPVPSIDSVKGQGDLATTKY